MSGSPLVDFLLECIETEERSARSDLADFEAIEEWPTETAATLAGWVMRFARRVLADCEANRRIVALHAEDEEGGGLHVCHDSLADDSECGELRALASVYAGARGFREEWL